ncbi:MAG: hypothetical protein FD163_2521 [Hyphomonadaceae bacterium]|nr:MAG: hypothetical protein FD128_746 [Hyphomonadaceae bacterium]KAF0182731.1 MAG: hypothetical protein FD163_2521 [Hyphomonadaceae bacterium]
MTINAVTIFSEDHRDEMVGLGTLIGMLPSLMNFSTEPPILLPKFVIHTRINFPPPELPEFLELTMIDVDGNIMMKHQVETTQIKSATDDAIEKGLSIVGMAVNIVMRNFAVTKDNEIKVHVKADDQLVFSGHIVFRFPEDTAVPTQ